MQAISRPGTPGSLYPVHTQRRIASAEPERKLKHVTVLAYNNATPALRKAFNRSLKFYSIACLFHKLYFTLYYKVLLC